MPELIVAKVAAIADDTTLVLNVGVDSGVSEGMVFAIVAEQQEIVDPDSGKSLGNWEVVKAHVIVEHVQERMCTVRSPLKKDVDTTGTLSTMMVQHSFGVYGSETSDRASLQVHASGVAGRPKLRPIEVGDRARLVGDELPSGSSEAVSEREPVAPDLPSKTYATAAAATVVDQAPEEAPAGDVPTASPASDPGKKSEAVT